MTCEWKPLRGDLWMFFMCGKPTNSLFVSKFGLKTVNQVTNIM